MQRLRQPHVIAEMLDRAQMRTSFFISSSPSTSWSDSMLKSTFSFSSIRASGTTSLLSR